MSRKRFNNDFKMEAIRLVTELNRSVPSVANDIGVHPNTIYKWIEQYHKDPNIPFVGSGNLKPEEKELRDAKRKISDLEEEIAILKKAITIFTKPPR